MSFATRIKNAYLAFVGATPIEPARTVELLEMQPGDKLLICYSGNLSEDVCRRLRDHFDTALHGDKRVVVMGSEVPKFVIVRGLANSCVEVSEKKAA